MTIKNRRNFIIGATFLALAIAALLYAQLTTEDSGLTVARGNMTPNSYPNFILSAMAVFALMLMGANIRFESGPATKSDQASSRKPVEGGKNGGLRAIGGIGLTALYIILLPMIGYIASSIIMMIMFIWLFGGRNIKVAIPLSVGLSLALYWFFVKVMNVLMP